MKKLLGFLIIIILAFECSKEEEKLYTINPIIGDSSFEQKFGYSPNSEDNNWLRIHTHLVHAEHLLRNKDVSHLNNEQKTNRKKLLNLLKDYHERGKFPQNAQYKDQRRPCFIDDEGTVCAVGYLVEQTLGLETAKKINANYQYATIAEMRDYQDLLSKWGKKNGLTIEEIATIQPTYEYRKEQWKRRKKNAKQRAEIRKKSDKLRTKGLKKGDGVYKKKFRQGKRRITLIAIVKNKKAVVYHKIKVGKNAQYYKEGSRIKLDEFKKATGS